MCDDHDVDCKTPPLSSSGIQEDDQEKHAILIACGCACQNETCGRPGFWEIHGSVELGRRPDRAAGTIDLADPSVSRRHARVTVLAADQLRIEDLHSANGTFINGVRIRVPTLLQAGSVIGLGKQVLLLRFCSPQEMEALKQEQQSPFRAHCTLSPRVAMQNLRLRRLARSGLDLLLSGETGSGKEIAAMAIHSKSGRPGPFVPINCAALPESLIESELFGYARGAHSTAALSKSGLMARANGGTLFLDEIGELGHASQAKLLRFLETRSYIPLGSTQTLHMDVRVLAATNRSLDDEMPLRNDLLARLGAEPVQIPPLRERLEDLGLLVTQFLAKGECGFAADAYRSLYQQTWVGNIRELKQVVEWAKVLAGNGLIGMAHLPERFFHEADPVSAPETKSVRTAPSSADLERLLELHAGNVGKVARELGRQRTLVWRWLRNRGVDPQRYRLERRSEPS